MFDQNDQNQQTQDASIAAPTTDVNYNTTPAAADTSASSMPAYNLSAFPDPTTAVAPATDQFAAPSPTTEDTAPVPSVSQIDTPIVAADPVVAAPTQNAADGSLLSIKQDALQSLTPLLSHLEQTPEEKFRTTMMMIQASDDQSLLQAAYDAANAITDEKIKAQALLDVVNEINYFTQAKPGAQAPQA